MSLNGAARMDPEIAERIERMKAVLAEMEIEGVQPANPYCWTAILLGSPREPQVVLNFWKGEPESVEFFNPVFPLKAVPRVEAAIRGASEIIDRFPLA
jgi:hypothetical protein